MLCMTELRITKNSVDKWTRELSVLMSWVGGV